MEKIPLIFKKTNSSKLGGIERNTVYLNTNNWDDYSFKTTFNATVYDASGKEHEIGQLKIGYTAQPHSWTAHSLPDVFSGLPEGYFSLGQDAEYYSNLRALHPQLRSEFLEALRDVVYDNKNLEIAKSEKVFKDSLLRGVNYSTITEQFKRVLDGGHILTKFRFGFKTEDAKDRAGFYLTFDVIPNVKPSTNIHVLIGRNGIGKTTLLNGMIETLVGEHPLREGTGQFLDTTLMAPSPIAEGHFSGVVSVSFSAFDPFTPPLDRDGDATALQYSYIGLKKVYVKDEKRNSEHKDLEALSDDFVPSLVGCFGLSAKRERWEKAIQFLESDLNFSEMDLGRLLQIEDQEELKQRAKKMFLKMSSGHAIVLLTITKLVERAEEKTLVIMDEPESHLHPPLLSAFTRALADLLNKINGIAIIATHSPVVLQEVPKSCVWKLYRTRLVASRERPEMETFAENVGILTREVFSLEVNASGFHDLLSQSVREGKSYEEILEEYNDQIGFEGKAILRAFISNRNKSQDLV